MQQYPILATKLYSPPVRTEWVGRPRLIARLQDSVGSHGTFTRKLSLISAPAGFGKTTLVTGWLESLKKTNPTMCIAWLSLDEADNDPDRFLNYMIAAIRQCKLSDGSFGSQVLSMLQSAQPQWNAILTSLINELMLANQQLVFVLDDYHVIHDDQIHDVVSFLIQNQPQHLHLVISSREDPPFPLSRMRVRQMMTEFRASDLRFTTSEISTFLSHTLEITLTQSDVNALEQRTEGWIAGLQLAALSMRNANDVSAFVQSFTGSHRYVLDYLLEEVLSQQSEATQTFLLQTSILNRMNGELCDALTGQDDGHETLTSLERANLFIVPLDEERRWYRYHHLFADLLRRHLEQSTSPNEMKSLHRRASQWYEENDFLIEAVEHRLAGEDYEDMIRLISEGASELFTRSQMSFLLRWWAEIPQKLVFSQLALCITYAWVWVATGRPEEAERCMQTIEQALDTEMTELYAAGAIAGAMAPAVRDALVEVAVVRAQLAIEQGNVSEALKLARLALPYLEDDEGPYLHSPPLDSRTIVFFVMGLAHKIMGDLDAANEAFAEASALAQERSNVHIIAGTFGHQAGIQVIQGHLRQAMQTCQRGLQLVQAIAKEHSPISGLMQVALGNALYMQDNLEAALHHLQEGIATAKPWAHWRTLVPGCTGLAQVRVAQGDWEGAFATLNELVALCKDNAQGVMPTVESLRAMLWAAQGEVDKARRWAQSAGLDVDSEISFPRENELIILVRVLMAQKEWNKAACLIDRLLGATKAGKRWGHVIELLILQALVLNAQEKQDEVLEPLTRALALAEPEGYVRVFVDEGPPMTRLLYVALSRGIQPTYVQRLLAAFPDTPEMEPPSQHAHTDILFEPLSDREIEVLQLISDGLTNPEIAKRLYLSQNTVKAHARNIYGKLGVNNRTQAASRAKALGII